MPQYSMQLQYIPSSIIDEQIRFINTGQNYCSCPRRKLLPSTAQMVQMPSSVSSVQCPLFVICCCDCNTRAVL